MEGLGSHSEHVTSRRAFFEKSCCQVLSNFSYQLIRAIAITLIAMVPIMAFFKSMILPAIATLIFPLALAHTVLTTVNPTTNGSNLEPLPNPYHVPGTDITLDFLPQPPLPPQPPLTDIIKLFEIARSDIEFYILILGDGPILDREYVLVYGKAEITLTSTNAPMDPMTYSDALSVISGTTTKLGVEGYGKISMRVIRTGTHDLIGFAAVSRPGVIRDTSI